MNTYEINKEMSKEKCFIGTFALDKLPKYIKKRPLALVLNLDKQEDPGSHWTAVFIDENNIANYFDSFGMKIPEEVKKFLQINKVKAIYYNNYMLQSLASVTCGAFCILFLKMRCNGFSLNEFLQLYSANTLRNDLIAVSILE